LQVLDRPGSIQLRVFELEHLSEWKVFARAIPGKLKAAYQQGALTALGRRALKALLQRDPNAFRRKCLHGLSAPVAIPQNTAYQLWREKHHLSEIDRARMVRTIAELKQAPLVSLLLPLESPVAPEALPLIESTVKSLVAQPYRHWELWLATDG